MDKFAENVESQRILFKRKNGGINYSRTIDAAGQDAWKAYQLIKKEKFTDCAFLCCIVRAYLSMYKKPPSKSTVGGLSSSWQRFTLIEKYHSQAQQFISWLIIWRLSILSLISPLSETFYGLELKMTKSQNNSFELEAFKVFNWRFK